MSSARVTASLRCIAYGCTYSLIWFLTAYNYTNIDNSAHNPFSCNLNWHVHMLKIVEFHALGIEHVAVIILHSILQFWVCLRYIYSNRLFWQYINISLCAFPFQIFSQNTAINTRSYFHNSRNMHNHVGIRPLPPYVNQWYCCHFLCDSLLPLKSQNSASTHNLSQKTCWYLHSKITTEIKWTNLSAAGATTVFWEYISAAHTGTSIHWIPAVTCRRMECKCTAHSGAGEEQIYLYDIWHFEHHIVSYILHVHNVQFHQVNTHKNCACVYWNISVSGWKLLGWSDDMEGKKLIFDLCAFFCMSLCAPFMWAWQSPLCTSLSGTSQSSGWPQSSD